jgi:hypothetical protein
MTNLLSPAVWCDNTQVSVDPAGTWLRALRSESSGDGVVLCYLEPGVVHRTNSERPTNLLVLRGSLTIGNSPTSRLAHSHTYTPLGSESMGAAQESPALAILVSGPGLGTETKSLRSPRDWIRAGPGLLSIPLCDIHPEGDLAERVVGFAHLEPGGSVPSHPHATTHIFVYLEGEADDEILFPDGRREVAQRHPGDFVTYPFPVQHRLFSRNGCSIFFLHEPISYDQGS